ncbi:MAG: hypothetical protein AAF493_14910 [Pseudomonadota bacterium]
MHIILGFLGTLVTVLILLNRLADAGIDLAGLNPFLWHRRRAWRRKYTGSPIYQLTSPMETTALLMVTVAKLEGDLSREQKRLILFLFESEFHLERREAASLLTATAHILDDVAAVRDNLEKVVSPSRPNFSPEQSASTIELVKRVGAHDSPLDSAQHDFVVALKKSLQPPANNSGQWQ